MDVPVVSSHVSVRGRKTFSSKVFSVADGSWAGLPEGREFGLIKTSCKERNNKK